MSQLVKIRVEEGPQLRRDPFFAYKLIDAIFHWPSLLRPSSPSPPISIFFLPPSPIHPLFLYFLHPSSPSLLPTPILSFPHSYNHSLLPSILRPSSPFRSHPSSSSVPVRPSSCSDSLRLSAFSEIESLQVFTGSRFPSTSNQPTLAIVDHPNGILRIQAFIAATLFVFVTASCVDCLQARNGSKWKAGGSRNTNFDKRSRSRDPYQQRQTSLS